MISSPNHVGPKQQLILIQNLRHIVQNDVRHICRKHVHHGCAYMLTVVTSTAPLVHHIMCCRVMRICVHVMMRLQGVRLRRCTIASVERHVMSCTCNVSCYRPVSPMACSGFMYNRWANVVSNKQHVTRNNHRCACISTIRVCIRMMDYNSMDTHIACTYAQDRGITRHGCSNMHMPRSIRQCETRDMWYVKGCNS